MSGCAGHASVPCWGGEGSGCLGVGIEVGEGVCRGGCARVGGVPGGDPVRADSPLGGRRGRFVRADSPLGGRRGRFVRADSPRSGSRDRFCPSPLASAPSPGSFWPSSLASARSPRSILSQLARFEAAPGPILSELARFEVVPGTDFVRAGSLRSGPRDRLCPSGLASARPRQRFCPSCFASEQPRQRFWPSSLAFERPRERILSEPTRFQAIAGTDPTRADSPPRAPRVDLGRAHSPPITIRPLEGKYVPHYGAAQALIVDLSQGCDELDVVRASDGAHVGGGALYRGAVCNEPLPMPPDWVGVWDYCDWFWCDAPPSPCEE